MRAVQLGAEDLEGERSLPSPLRDAITLRAEDYEEQRAERYSARLQRALALLADGYSRAEIAEALDWPELGRVAPFF